MQRNLYNEKKSITQKLFKNEIRIQWQSSKFLQTIIVYDVK